MRYDIPKRTLGRTGLNVTVISLGGAPLGSTKDCFFYGREVGDDPAINTVRVALESGINYIDTSPLYGDSERRIGMAIRGIDRKSFVLSTKAGTRPGLKGYSAKDFRKSVEMSLSSLGVDYVDILNIHDPDEKDFAYAMSRGGAFEEMLKMREEGLIRFFGLGARPHELHRRFIESGNADVILTFLDYNLLRQNANNLLHLCRERNVGAVIGSPLCMGYLSGKDPRTIPSSHHHNMSVEVDMKRLFEMYDWCKKKGIGLQQINNHFILEHPGVSTVLIGASSPDEVRENIRTIIDPLDTKLYKEFLDRFQLSEFSSA